MFIRILAFLFFISPIHSSFAQNDQIDFYNNPELLSNSFGEYKGVKLDVKDKKIIEEECSVLMNHDTALHSKCKESFRNTAISFKVDSELCKKKAKRLDNVIKEKKLLLIDDEGNLKTFIVRDAKFLEGEEYEKCMDKMRWKDSMEFRYGKY